MKTKRLFLSINRDTFFKDAIRRQGVFTSMKLSQYPPPAPRSYVTPGNIGNSYSFCCLRLFDTEDILGLSVSTLIGFFFKWGVISFPYMFHPGSGGKPIHFHHARQNFINFFSRLLFSLNQKIPNAATILHQGVPSSLWSFGWCFSEPFPIPQLEFPPCFTLCFTHVVSPLFHPRWRQLQRLFARNGHKPGMAMAVEFHTVDAK